MIDLGVFFFALLSGWLIRKELSDKTIEIVKKTSYYTLLLFIIISIWKYGFPKGSWLFFSLGASLILAPLILSLFLKSKALRLNFLVFSTYGGGNRGTIALSILSPTLLPWFLIVDLGNFFALIIFYPFFIKYLINDYEKNHFKVEYKSFLISILVILIGAVLHHYVAITLINVLYLSLKYLLVSVTSFQIGIFLIFNTKCLIETLYALLKVRLVALVIPLLMVIFLFDDHRYDAIYILLLFMVLPVSSIAVSFFQKDNYFDLQQRLSCAITSTSLFFIVILLVSVLIKGFF